MDKFSGALWDSRFNKVVYHESHDESGNARGTMRTSKAAVNDAPLVGVTRKFAEARSRVAFGLSALSAGTPMFFMGEEIVAQKIYKYDNVLQAKEDFAGERAGEGSRMFRFYQDLIRLRKRQSALRSREIDVIHAYNATRIIAFVRRDGMNEFLIVASLNNMPFQDGYNLQTEPARLGSGFWQEVLNSDAAIYGGDNIGNYGTSVRCENGQIQVRLPANAILAFQRL